MFIDLLRGDDGDRMVAPGAHHVIHQTPLPTRDVVLQDLITSSKSS